MSSQVSTHAVGHSQNGLDIYSTRSMMRVDAGLRVAYFSSHENASKQRAATESRITCGRLVSRCDLRVICLEPSIFEDWLRQKLIHMRFFQRSKDLFYLPQLVNNICPMLGRRNNISCKIKRYTLTELNSMKIGIRQLLFAISFRSFFKVFYLWKTAHIIFLFVPRTDYYSHGWLNRTILLWIRWGRVHTFFTRNNFYAKRHEVPDTFKKMQVKKHSRLATS